MTILIDSHETSEVKERGLKKFKNNLRIETLLTGDVLCNGACVERKEVKDLISSATSKDKHLQKQALKMTAYDTRILVVEGSFIKLCEKEIRYKKYDSKWFYGLVASLNVKYGIMVHQVPNNREFWKFIERLNYKMDEKKEIEASRIYTPKISYANSKRVDLSQLCCIPGLSEKIGLNILGRFSLFDLYYATLEDLQTVDKVGPVLARKIKSEFKTP